MDIIEHSNIFDFLSFDTGIDENDLKAHLLKNGVRSFMDYALQNGLSILNSGLSLGSELMDSNGKVLLNKGVPLEKYLNHLLERYVKDENYSTSPLKVVCTPEVINSYKEKAKTKVDIVLNDFIFSQDKYAAFYNSVKNDGMGIKPVETFDKSISHLLSFPHGISSMVRIFRNINAKQELLTDNINTAFISICIAPYCSSKQIISESDTLVIKIALTAVLQDIASLMECGLEQTCLERSAIIAKSLVNDESVEEAIRVKHCVTGIDSVPVFSDAMNKTNFFLRILITVNLFVEIVKINKTDPFNLEVHKSMYELAEMGYADKEITSFISRLFLPEVKHLVLQYAYTIKNTCPQNPIIWSTTGDMLPVKFICGRFDCQYSGQHKTLIPKDVKIEADEIYQTRINAGTYCTCKALTDKLQAYYKSVVQKQDE